MRAGVGRGQPEAAQQLEVGAELDLVVQLGTEVAVAQCREGEDAAAADVECLVLRGEVGRTAGRAVRCAQLQLGDLRDEPPRLYRGTPCDRHTAEGRPAIADAA